MSGRPLRLVLLLEDLDFGGTQRYAVNLVPHLDRTKFDPAIWTLRGGDDFRPAISTAGIAVIDLTRTEKVGPGAILRLASRLWRERPDVLYTLTVLPNIWGRLFAGLLGITVVSGYRNHRPGQHEWLLARFSAKIIANAERLKDELTTRFA
ncbi:MAG: glycosyltransferase, partial [Hyphomicrobiales bacterium]|nr:glycosyltransferase [Hyphomicrobiales bacterium]